MSCEESNQTDAVPTSLTALCFIHCALYWSNWSNMNTHNNGIKKKKKQTQSYVDWNVMEAI